MKYLYVLLALATIYATSSCKKERQPPVPPQTDSVYRVSTAKFYFIEQASFYNETYSYDAKGRILKMENTQPNGTLMGFQTYERDQDQLKAYHLHNNAAVKVASHICHYENNQLKKLTYTEFRPAPVEVFEHAYEYTQGLLTKSTYTNTATGASYYAVFTWTEGNITRIVSYNLPDSTWMEENRMEYDNKPNPFYNLGGLPDGNARYNSRNNVVRSLVMNEDGSLKQEFLLEYVYNEKGYPIDVFSSFPDGKKLHEQTFTYAHFPIQ
jgi:hypothetical protein